MFVPIEPARVYDSRLAGPGGTPLPIPVTTAPESCRWPTPSTSRPVTSCNATSCRRGATAVAFNLTATNTQARGWFSITRQRRDLQQLHRQLAGRLGRDRRGLTVQIAPDRTVKVFNGSTMPTDAVLDTSGYFIDPAQAGNVFHDITPTRVHDSRIAGPGGTANPDRREVEPGDQRGQRDRPRDARRRPRGRHRHRLQHLRGDTAGRGWFAVTSGDASAYRASTVNWAGPGDVIDNGQFG